jgi:phosphatidate cytidylyltransferase
VLRDRAISAAVLIPPLIVVLAVGGLAITIVVAALVALAAVEVFRLLRAAGHPVQPWLGLAYAVVVSLAIAVALDAATVRQLAGSALLLASVGLSLVAVGAFARPDPREGLAAWMTTAFGALYVAQLGFVVRLGQVAPPLASGAPAAPLGPDRSWILLLVLGVWAYDTGAYFAGRRFGRARFLVHISPSKTYAGLIGGLAACTIVVALGLWATGQPPAHALALGPLLGLAAQAGDLAESMLKRAAGAKDSSNLIPGHGGVLDRIDSFLFAAPVATLYVLALLG